MNNEAIIRLANDELLGQGNVKVIPRFFAPEYVVHAGGKEYTGLEFIERFIGLIRASISDLRVVDIQVLSKVDDVVTWVRVLTRLIHEIAVVVPALGQSR